MQDESRIRPARWARIGSTIRAGVVVCGIAALSVAARDAHAQQAPAGRLNKIIERAEKGGIIFNNESWLLLPDQEHDPFGLQKMERAMAALRPAGSEHPTLTPLVRMSMEATMQEKHRVKQLLDGGVMGIILPQVETAAQVREFVSSMRYPPQQGGRFYGGEPVGKRGWSPGLAVQFWGVTTPEYARKADLWPLNPEGELIAAVLIETKQAIDNIEEILEVPGLGIAFLGMGDLSMSLGVGNPGSNPNDPAVMAAADKMGAACRAHRARGGKVLCGRYQIPDGIDAAIAKGFTIFTAERGNYRGDTPGAGR
jgi:4-hydroxy-2-oxoheptanedioate aldolase